MKVYDFVMFALIHGAAGGVGTFAVQLAKWKGAHVIGTASGELGVDEPIDYEKTRFEDVVHDVDVVRARHYRW